jgi:hypothetical protein
MHRKIESRLGSIAVVLIAFMVIIGCTPCTECWDECLYICDFDVDPFGLESTCLVNCPILLCPLCYISPTCTENPDECAATFGQFQLAAIEFCEQYPEQCQQAFDTWVESMDEAKE